MVDQLNSTHANHYDVRLLLEQPQQQKQEKPPNVVDVVVQTQQPKKEPTKGIVAIEQDDDAVTNALFGHLNGNSNYNLTSISTNSNHYQLCDIEENESQEIRFSIRDDVIPGPPPPEPSTSSTTRMSKSNPSYGDSKKPSIIKRSVSGSSMNKKNQSINTSSHTVSSGGGNSGGKTSKFLRSMFSKASADSNTPIRDLMGDSNNTNDYIPSPSSPLFHSDRVRKGISHSSTPMFNSERVSKEDQLQLSITEHDQSRWTGNGLLANVADLSIPKEQFVNGCQLLYLCAIGNRKAVESLLDEPNTPVNVNFRDYDRRTALHVAASEGHLHICQLLIERGAKINRSDRWGGSPLDDARRHGHQAVIDYLLKQGGTTGSGNRFVNLITASAGGDIDEVKLLLRQLQATPKITFTNDPSSGQRTASGESSHSVLLKSLVNRTDYDRRTALHLAAGEGHVEIIQELYNAGGDINAEDRWKRRPLDDAIAGNHTEAIELLRSLGATTGATTSLASNTTQKDDPLNSSSMKRFIDTNMQVEFNELEMIDRIGSGAFGEIYKCRWRGTLVAAKIIKTAKIQKVWLHKKLTNDIKKRHVTDDDIDNVIDEMDAVVDAEKRQRSLHDTMHEQQADVAASEATNSDGVTVAAANNNNNTKKTEEDIEREMAVNDFRQEISVLRSLRHPNIVLLLAYSTTTDYECLISELMKCSLLDVFKSHLVQGTKMSKHVQLLYSIQLAQGMNYLHTCKPPIIHRDLKPANLLIDYYSGVLKISDFGLSKIRPNPKSSDQNDSNSNNNVDRFVMTGETGSYRFMAPEVYRHEQYNETVDIYSYSMIVYYLFVGQPPWPTLPGDVAVRKAAMEGDRPVIPRDIDHRIHMLLKECWNDVVSLRPSFATILKCLTEYGQTVFHHYDSNNVVVSQELARTIGNGGSSTCCGGNGACVVM